MRANTSCQSLQLGRWRAINIHKHSHMHTHTYTHTPTHIRTRLHTHTHAHTHTHTHKRTHTHTQTHTRTHAHSHTHTHIVHNGWRCPVTETATVSHPFGRGSRCEQGEEIEACDLSCAHPFLPCAYYYFSLPPLSFDLQVTLQMLLAQPCLKVLVGDSNQHIYRWVLGAFQLPFVGAVP